MHLKVLGCVFLLLSYVNCGFFGSVFSNKAISSQQQALLNAVILRSGYPGQRKLWHYKGTVQNSVSGKSVCGIQGLEYSKCLKIERGDVTNGTFMTHKAFIYTDISNSSTPLRRYQSRRYSPKKNVKSEKILHELVTLSSTRDGKITARVEFPSGRCLVNQGLRITGPSRILGGEKEFKYENHMNVNKVRSLGISYNHALISILTLVQFSDRWRNKWVCLQPPIAFPGQSNKGTREMYTLRSSPSFGLVSLLSGMQAVMVERMSYTSAPSLPCTHTCSRLAYGMY